jgi:hypothetical protein
LNNLAALYREQGRFGIALPLIKRVMAQNAALKSIAFPVLYNAQSQHLISSSEGLSDGYNVLQR